MVVAKSRDLEKKSEDKWLPKWSVRTDELLEMALWLLLAAEDLLEGYANPADCPASRSTIESKEKSLAASTSSGRLYSGASPSSKK